MKRCRIVPGNHVTTGTHYIVSLILQLLNS